jgi:hypothetical protein
MATAKTKAQLQAEAKAKLAAAKPAVKPAAKTAPEDAKAVAPVEPVAPGVIFNMQDLTRIVTATYSADGFCYVPETACRGLEAEGLVELNRDMKDANGAVAARATPAGMARVTQAASPFPAFTPIVEPASETVWAPPQGVAPAPAPASAPVAKAATRTVTKPPEGGFKIMKGITPPPAAPGFGVRTAVYPFASLNVGESFFVAATEQRPKPSKSLASTVNSAMSRFAVDGVKTRLFSLRAVQTTTAWPDGSTGGAPWGQPGVAGAMVTRTA